MALDGFVISNIVYELNQTILNAKISRKTTNCSSPAKEATGSSVLPCPQAHPCHFYI